MALAFVKLSLKNMCASYANFTIYKYSLPLLNDKLKKSTFFFLFGKSGNEVRFERTAIVQSQLKSKNPKLNIEAFTINLLINK